jgi:hypothetical protein
MAAGGAAAAAAIPAGGAWEPDEPETLLVPLTRPRTPRGAAAASPSFPEAPETARFDGDGVDTAVPEQDGGYNDGAEADAPETAG